MSQIPRLIRPRHDDSQAMEDFALIPPRRRLIAIATEGRFLDPDHAHVDELREIARTIASIDGTEALAASIAYVVNHVGWFEAETIDRIWDGIAGWHANWAVNHQLDLVH